jgi:propanol-preferring alcohol dehydrogenase
VRIAVAACAVCRTDLHIVDGELPAVPLPIVPGHEIVGHIDALGSGVTGLRPGQRVGVPWLGWVCGECEYCLRGEENLCGAARFTGYQIDGGFASAAIADARFVLPLPDNYPDVEAAPLLCAGLIGWRCLKACGDARRLGLYGFGAAAHLVIQCARARGQQVYAFVKPGDSAAAQFALGLGAVWAGDSTQPSPEELDAAILFAPVGALVPLALQAVRRGGVVVCGGIHMSAIPSFPYSLLWGERQLRSVANLTRQDGAEFMDFAGQHTLQVATRRYALGQVNEALADLRRGNLSGAAVLVP